MQHFLFYRFIGPCHIMPSTVAGLHCTGGLYYTLFGILKVFICIVVTHNKASATDPALVLFS